MNFFKEFLSFTNYVSRMLIQSHIQLVQTQLQQIIAVHIQMGHPQILSNVVLNLSFYFLFENIFPITIT